MPSRAYDRLLSLLALSIAIGFSMPVLSDEHHAHIRTLAASCQSCHGNQSPGKAIPNLAGLDENYFIQQMTAYQHSSDVHQVMVQHAKGLTETEIRQLAEYFARQSRACPYFQKHPLHNDWSQP